MDIQGTIVTAQAVSLPQKGGDIPVLPKPAIATEAPKAAPKQAEPTLDYEQLERQRLQAVRQAADFFAVSDKKFTIYKDISGQYITRFRSLRDGTVTYIPEPTLLTQYHQRASRQQSALLNMEA